MDNQIKREQLINIMSSMDMCLLEIKYALDKLQFDQVTKLVAVLTEAFIAVNEFVESEYATEIDDIREQLTQNLSIVNKSLVDVLSSFDNHDMEIRVGSFKGLQDALFIWTGYLYYALKLHR
jgi:archaellum component FlaC